jgi:predicted CoA-substrate-specific enzyme activase
MVYNYSEENLYLGVDLGSTAIKFIGIDDKGAIVWNYKELTCPDVLRQVSQTGYKQFVGKNIKSVCATGYGRKSLNWADRVTTEIICQARGIANLYKEAETVIDIGGQDTKIIRLKNSKIANFKMNDKCAAGTGRFIEKIASILNCSLNALSQTVPDDDSIFSINSTCVVFAETEIISLVAQGKSVKEIANSFYYSLANRIASSVKAFGLKETVVLTGGLGSHKCLVYWLQKLLCCKVFVPDFSQYSAAYGAALLAKENLSEKDNDEENRLLLSTGR